MLSRADISRAESPDWLAWALDRPGASSHVDVGGARLHYLSWGLDRKDKPALLLIHGFRGHAHWWDAVAPFLADRFRVIAVDLIGMGDSDRRATYTRAGLIADIAAVITGLGLGPVSCAAHSFGGELALRAIAAHPALFGELVLIDTKTSFSAEELNDKLAAPRTRRTYPDRATALARFRLAPPQPELPAALAAHLADHSVQQVKDGWTWKFDPTLFPPDLGPFDIEPVMSRVSNRVHYVYGESSFVVSAERAALLHGRLPNAGKLIGIPGGHHHVILDNPPAVVAVLRALLQ